jgi:hypothetical protein
VRINLLAEDETIINFVKVSVSTEAVYVLCVMALIPAADITAIKRDA